ncbi:hypothetical protein CYY_005937 [Polysphondylium violaceum]|uniref:Peptidase S8/S53 domain-containing protein n=1 Tax=Polysphondylium violaceum TaxID=133409 RepID=A0A8J4V6E2_9MYCE|nr:hypothetical protein CYY_005937 [Polysphondylium violaceum]
MFLSKYFVFFILLYFLISTVLSNNINEVNVDKIVNRFNQRIFNPLNNQQFSKKYLDTAHTFDKKHIINIWVFFKDKPITDIKDLKSLSKEALDRRSKRGFNNNNSVENGKDLTDFPVHSKYVDQILKLRSKEVIKIRKYSKWLNAASVKICLNSKKNGDMDVTYELRKILADIINLSCVDRIDEVNKFKPPHEVDKQLVSSKLVNEDSNSGKGSSSEPTDSIYGEIDYGRSYDQLNMIGVLEAQSKGFMGENVSILLIDSGFLKTHEAFNNTKIIDEKDFIDNDSETQSSMGNAQNYHGTSTLSCLASWVPGRIIGAAPHSSYLLAKTEIVDEELEIEEDYLIAAIEWGESKGVSIISVSLGYPLFYKYWEIDGSSPVSTAIDIASTKGVVVVVSNGNNGNTGVYPPADSKMAISVGAIDSYGEIASFSAIGPTPDGRIKPEVCARGVFNYVASADSNRDYGFLSGTSFSAPLVAGAVALVLQAHPNWSPKIVKEALIYSTGNDDPDNYKGFGTINAMLAIEYNPSNNTCAQDCGENGYCVQGKCQCSHNINSSCTAKVLCGFICKSNGGQCSNKDCFKCLDSQAKNSGKKESCGDIGVEAQYPNDLSKLIPGNSIVLGIIGSIVSIVLGFLYLN